jgi:hypothetical protein
VVDIAMSQPDAVEDVPVGPEAFEDRADLALAFRAASRAIGHFLGVFPRRAPGARYRLRSHDRSHRQEGPKLEVNERYTFW